MRPLPRRFVVQFVETRQKYRGEKALRGNIPGIIKKVDVGLGCRSVVEYVLNLHKGLAWIPTHP